MYKAADPLKAAAFDAPEDLFPEKADFNERRETGSFRESAIGFAADAAYSQAMGCISRHAGGAENSAAPIIFTIQRKMKGIHSRRPWTASPAKRSAKAHSTLKRFSRKGRRSLRRLPPSLRIRRKFLLKRRNWGWISIKSIYWT
ncbi:MAG: hypothetical protein LBU32_00760 [Clostridiales bacterium]|jgi:hypothetical protein|nr:hypothetical protein [Clostridiales bacterium]